jgi:meiosis-specific transcription factor NDT80
MAPGQRPISLPSPASYSTRNIYQQNPPLYTRVDQNQRSPQFQGAVRRNPLSPTPSPSIGYSASLASIRMDNSHYNAGKGQTNVPPLQSITTHGHLSYVNPHSQPTPIDKIDIQGTIDKGFFLSEGEWTCYRRNYFSCICSFSLDPPNLHNLPIRYTQTASGVTYDIFDFAMTITAVVSESDAHQIDLVQHTPKRDKGPTSQPERVKLSPKHIAPSSHPLGSVYGNYRIAGPGAVGAGYGDYSQSQGAHPTEHTFERIQFKQATANNGKRRAAQQYYHLVIELHANVGEMGRGVADQWLRVAHRKSAKMIVRGRSPGHYQSERRGSTSSGPGGSSGTLGSYPGQGPEYNVGSSILSPTYGTQTAYETRPTHHYGTNRHHEMQIDQIMSADQCKSIDNTKGYQYYPGAIYEGHDQRDGGIHCYPRNDQDTMIPSLSRNENLPISRLKHENESQLPSLCMPGPNYLGPGCNRYEGKSTSAGYYPISQTS